MDDYRLGDLLDMEMLQKLADSNYRASGLPMTIIDAIDQTILIKAGWPEICNVFHRAHPVSESRCRVSDRYVNDHRGDCEVLQYKCGNGLWHVAFPIVVADTHLATLFLTQFFFEGELPDREYFTHQAVELGYDLNRYLAAVDAMPVFTREKVEYITAYDLALVRFVSDLAEQSIRIITTRKSLIESEVKYRSLVNNVNIGVCRVAVSGEIIQANPAMARIYGFDSTDEFMTTDVSTRYQNPSDRLEFIEIIRRSGSVKDREFAMHKRDGTPIWCSVSVAAQFDENCEIAWMDAVVEDITERKRTQEQLQKAHDELETRVKERTADLAKTNELLLTEIIERKRFEEKLRELSETDPLTGIFNRRKFFDLLQFEINKAKRYGRPLSLLMFDLDHFKQVNDTFGHSIGDMVLAATTGIVTKTIRNTDIFARYGGEEFIIVLTETHVSGAAELAEKIRAAVARHHFPVAGQRTISIGIAEFSGKEDETEFITRADNALYTAKKEGRNRVETALAG
ncbi:MAG: diguanylate cyclase [Desulfoprunum sp.]|nr:diguanylate cyclase [Desulfoprunum sp.]